MSKIGCIYSREKIVLASYDNFDNLCKRTIAIVARDLKQNDMRNGNSIHPAKSAESFFQKETFCESLFHQGEPYWHLCTNGTVQEIIFRSPEDFTAAMNLLALTVVESNITIYTFCLMNNHIHAILSCSESAGFDFFERFRKRLVRYMTGIDEIVNLGNFRLEKLLPIENLDTLRKEIVYVNRNGYVANRNYNPFSYPWGSGCLYFNKTCRYWTGTPICNLSFKEKRNITHSRIQNLNKRFEVADGIILPSSYCSVKEGELLFRDSWHYFSMLTKNYEAYGLVAKRLADSSFLTDEEVYPAVKELCMTRFNVKSPHLLSDSQKRELVIYMHNEMCSTNDQIRRVLGVDLQVLRELFPMSK